jgi:excinuclease ABC subunit C
VLRKQKIETPGGDDIDVVGIATGKDEALGLVLRIRRGRLIGKEQRTLVRTDGLPRDEVLEHFLTRFYGGQDVLPGRLALPYDPPSPELVAEWLEGRTGRKVRLVVPRRGKLAGLLRVAMRNAALVLEESRARAEGERRLGPELYELQEALGLANPPVRIEGVDVSTIHGTDKVASVVCFIAGRPEKALYRRYRIKTVEGADDFASIQEVVDRRVSRALDEGQDLPDLFLIDGGKGQLGAARRALAKYDLESLPAVGLAKREELVIFHDRPALRLSRRSDALKLLQRIRNEAHRFAVGYHRTLRSKRLTRSALDDVPGIGPHRKALLLSTFGSVDTMRRASEAELAAIPGIGRATARTILEVLARPLPEEDAPPTGSGADLAALDDGDALDGLGAEEALALDDAALDDGEGALALDDWDAREGRGPERALDDAETDGTPETGS